MNCGQLVSELADEWLQGRRDVVFTRLAELPPLQAAAVAVKLYVSIRTNEPAFFVQQFVDALDAQCKDIP